ncbi:peptidylprolyl isomerase [Compostibacter hankyongensis]|uniref:Peptidyl-prolyl cis-trans isomerase n=1 Tax=Compostibacter hankyongensis TaxID=1007089 RepID=A0ABP8FE83_9BACT
MKASLLFALLLATTLATAQHRRVKIITPYGTMLVELSDKTPQHRNNFLRLVKKHFYDGLLFHRVIKDFMIQGGDPDSRKAAAGAPLGDGDVGHTVPAEFRPELFHRKGALAAAREGDDVNPQKASSGCQFYLVQGRTYTDAEMDQIAQRFGHDIPPDHRAVYKTTGGTPFLDMNYTVFGQVLKGMEVIDKIAALPTDDRDRPLKDVPMKIRRVHKFLFF